ncbi:MAG: vitamin B12-dependent ribonucleotide reductase [Thermoplasmata archaeon]|nr:vitamin B12-dependent ribonucleotide reductase [Candidatus Sysuiplasma acidicola]MBX8645428.1 vitamin B12-dependent ribonucleotide reductase [Candidatus Sysuiplasma acidicola]MDH2906037.1 vitamin B12-dependent ribonucleotide reductase [Methanomassiliicoccales archaeon]
MSVRNAVKVDREEVPQVVPGSGSQKRAGKNITPKKSHAGDQAGSHMKFERKFVADGEDPYSTVRWVERVSRITEPDGKIVFEMDNIMAPEGWSQLAVDIAVSKYFRKAGVPGTGTETSVMQLIHRVAHTIRWAGEQYDYFEGVDAENFEAELTYMLLHQMAAFNSPVWFNVGLYHEYGIKGSGGSWAWDATKGKVTQTEDAYSRPQCSACFIQSVTDDLMSIFDLLKNEARLFKYGSGTGTNFSKIRAAEEKLSGGGTSSGLMSFLKVLDAGAGATKSGGTTRRAAKMVVLDIDHPEIASFINWKVKEEEKVRALIREGYPADFNSEAYLTVSGQNSNNSVRVTDDFMNAFLSDGSWNTTYRTTGEIAHTYKAAELMEQVSKAAWASADPGMQFDTTINRWHTCPNSGRINASNPCSEYMFLDNTACNLASINLVKFIDEEGNFDIDGFRQTIRVFTTAMEIIVDFASYPTEVIAANSHTFRTLGLGFANLGTSVMLLGYAYDSDEARTFAAAISAIITGHCYRTSAEIAAITGPFPGFEVNKEAMLRVMGMHRDAIFRIDSTKLPPLLLKAAMDDWNECIKLGEMYGYRNAQASNVAPTGTIGLLMDCDTTGIEPDFSIVKWKKLAGGGYFKIVNKSVEIALRRLGYGTEKRRSIITALTGTGTLDGSPFINRDSLAAKGMSAEEIREALEYISRTHTMDDFTPHMSEKELIAMGFSREQVQATRDFVNGVQSMELIEDVLPEHVRIFDCANRSGRGKRFIAPMGHVKMMAAVQPFISGAISKTVNLPADVTWEDVRDVYVNSWRMGLKALAVYRDGSKASQPLSSAKEIGEEVLELGRGVKKELPKKRGGFTLESTIGGHKLFLRTGEYSDGTPGEIFIDMYKEGSSYRSILNGFAIAVSIGLQYGVPLEKYVNAFTFTRFEPQGFTDHPNVRTCTSPLDFIFRVLGMEYLGRTDFVQVKPSVDEKETAREPRPSFIHPSTKSLDEFSREEPAPDLMDRSLMFDSDAPLCSVCGHVTVRNGSCYKCLNCGSTTGCS